MLFVLLGCFLFCLPLFFVSAWWNRGIADEVTIASFCKAVTGTAVMARSANEEKKNCAMLLKNPELPTPGSLLTVSLNSLQLMFSQLTARSSSKLTLPSCALSSPTAQFLGISAVTIPNSVLFLRPVGLLSTTNLNRGVTPASLFLLRVLPVHASKFSLVTANKPVQGRVATFCVNLYSSVSPIKE